MQWSGKFDRHSIFEALALRRILVQKTCLHVQDLKRTL